MATIKNIVGDKDGQLNAKLRSLAKSKPELYELIVDVASEGQMHLFEDWTNREVLPSEINDFAEHLMAVDKACPDGLVGYIKHAKKLLKDSKEGANPLDGWKPSIPDGQAFELGTDQYTKVEKKGLRELGKVGFVLVAGGLGERLGYSGAKIGLPIETTTGTPYIKYYCEYIKAVELKMTKKGVYLPLCIMVSEDTKHETFRLLRENQCFGLSRRQIYVVEQGMGVPALNDSDARLVVKNEKLVMKPHGHGDIHALLHKHGITKEWELKGMKYMVLFQDTNGLAFHSLPLMLGVSEMNGFIMNSLAIPRKAKQAIGGIAKLVHEATGAEKTINVEYNQLDPLLRTTEEFKDGDVNDEETGYSPFPGNINQLVFQLKGYNEVLVRTQGRMPDFVNPKYADESKIAFKKATRLECMMQDFPSVLENEETKKVGYTQLTADLCFSPVKNSVADGVALQENGIAPGTAATGEADQYAAVRIMMRAAGVQVEDAEPVSYNGITVIPGPAIVMKPDFACCPVEYKIKFPSPENVKISSRSTLVCRGPGITIESLELDGALVIDVERGEQAIIRDLVVTNDGWVQVPVTDHPDERIAMRGFTINRKDAKYVEISVPEDTPRTRTNSLEDEGSYILEEQYGCPLSTGVPRAIVPSTVVVPNDDSEVPEESGCCVTSLWSLSE